MTAETTDKARRAAEQATKAEEAAEAARLAEEAAAKAREAARLAQIAAEAAAADAETDPEPEPEPEAAPEPESKSEPEAVPESEAAKSSETRSRDGEAPEGATGTAEDAADVSAPPEAASAPDETAEDAAAEGEEGGAEDTEDAPKRKRARTPKVPAAGTESRGVGALRSWTLVVVLVGLVLALGGATTMLALKVRDQKATETASRQGLFAASRAAQALSSYDYRSLDSDLKAGAEMTTGRLRGEFEKLAETLRTLAPRERAVSSTTVMKAGVVSASRDKVVALVYANRSSQTSSDKQQRLPEPLRIRLTMVKKQGKWLASELAVIS
ncbi:hypothetical protein [Actinomadura terrae]|uniref:hypothetical protein n=1 Tax=Actinomadura terrae TaxID=604353 RepID=UPI001FA7BA92|nr:hypothetical protein [Actinomadura terrae]